MKLFIVFLLLIFIFNCVCKLMIHYVYGCGRSFKRGRKCKRWDCPNRKECSFSEYKEE